MAIATATILTTAAILAVVSAGAGAYSTYQQGQFQKKAADYNAKVASNNAKLSQFQAQYDADRLRDRNRRLAARQAVSYAKSGVSIVEGSAYDVQYDSSVQGELDALTILYRGKTESTGYQSAAAYNRAVSANAKAMTPVNTGATLLGGLSSAASLGASAQTYRVAAENDMIAP